MAQFSGGTSFSANSFTRDAQDYAWAQNIFLVSFNNISFLLPILDLIETHVGNMSFKKLSKITKKTLINNFKVPQLFNRRTSKYPSLVVGVLDNAYPVTLIGPKGWLEVDIPTQSDNIPVAKTSRESNELDTLFKLDVFGKDIQFTVPNIIANKLINRIDRSKAGDKIFDIDLPVIVKGNDGNIRRMLRLTIFLPDRESYLSTLIKSRF